MNRICGLLALLGLSLLAACTSMPTGPRVMALPGTGKSFDQFRADDLDCRQYALAQVGGVPASQMAMESGLKSAAVGTAIGAVAGAAIGGHQGAGAGAGAGLLMGSMAGVGAADASAYRSQQYYDNAYIQCMYAKGDRVPVSGQFQANPGQWVPPPPSAYPPHPSSSLPPPPPSGYPPPRP